MRDLFELCTRALCDDTPNSKVESTYLFCQTTDNDAVVLDTARELLEKGLTDRILINRSSPLFGYPGCKDWQKKLKTRGVSQQQIDVVGEENPQILHTLVESRALVKHLKKNNTHSAYVVAPPFQQLRAFMTAITAAIEFFPDLTVYSYPSEIHSWQQYVHHSQGTLGAKRKDLIHTEFDRIQKYQEKGDLASCSAVLEYLEVRGRIQWDKN